MSREAAGLSLAQAVHRWCDPTLVATLKDLAEVLEEPPAGAVQTWVPRRIKDVYSPEERHALMREIDLGLRERLARGDLRIRGLQTKPTPQLVACDIPGVWAADFVFDWNVNAITFGDARYINIAIQEMPRSTAGAPAAAARPDGTAVLTPGDVRALSDETILVLLEEHARRVVQSPDAKLIAPGKISLLPIIKRRMEYRAAQGELLPKLADEAAVLADWIASKVVSHPVPTASTIGTSLGKTYAALRARSNAGIQTSEG